MQLSASGHVVSGTGPRQYAPGRWNLSTATTVIGLAAFAAVLHLFIPFNHDLAFFIEGAGRLLDGGRLGTEVMDINPPHVWWISLVPVWLAREIGIRSDTAATIFTAVMAATSLLACDRLIQVCSPVGQNHRALLAVAAIVLLFVPGYDFGQREHWALILTLPYVIARSRCISGATLSRTAGVIIGIAAGLGFFMNPHLLLVPATLEVWLLARTRRPFVWISAETVSMTVAGLAYLGLVIIYVPSYLEIEVPNALLGYWAFRGMPLGVVQAALVVLTPPAVLAIVGYRTRCKGEKLPALAEFFAVAGAAYFVAALLQMTPWSYHFLPGVALFYFSAAVLLLTGTPRAGMNSIRFGALMILTAISLLPSAAKAVQHFEGGGTTARVNQLAAVFRAHPGPNGIVSGFITSPRDVYPALVASRMKWALPVCCEYLIAAAVRADEAPAGKRAAIRAAGLEQARIAVAATRAKQPGVIVVDIGQDKLGFNGRPFSYVNWLKANTTFASVLAHYREIDPIGRFRLFVKK